MIVSQFLDCIHDGTVNSFAWNTALQSRNRNSLHPEAGKKTSTFAACEYSSKVSATQLLKIPRSHSSLPQSGNRAKKFDFVHQTISPLGGGGGGGGLGARLDIVRALS